MGNLTNRNEEFNLEDWAKQEIRKALKAYAYYVEDSYYKKQFLEPNSDFVDRLARDWEENKGWLYNLLSLHPKFDKNLGAVVYDCREDKAPNFDEVYDCIWWCLDKHGVAGEYRVVPGIMAAIATGKLLSQPEIKLLDEKFPKCYAVGKKPSRVFKAIASIIGIVDDSKGSEWAKDYAKVSDLLATKPHDYKLYVSVNPGHIITGSNPHESGMMVSCHSLDSKYDYSSGNVAYAADPSCLIVFTVKDSDECEEKFYNRKTSRQFFFYNGKGGLLQSRLYIAKSDNDYGGTEGAQNESVIYRNIVEKILSEAEAIPNLWEKPLASSSNLSMIYRNPRFGGYPDWNYNSYQGIIVFRKDTPAEDRTIKVGTHGRCIGCGDTIMSGVFCTCCHTEHECYECNESLDEDDIIYAYRHGDEVEICSYCESRLYNYCPHCGRTVHEDDGRWVGSVDHFVCDDCLDEHYTRCECCGEYFRDEDIKEVDGEYVCTDCLENDGRYSQCAECGEWHIEEHMNSVYDSSGELAFVCDDCFDSEKYPACPHCGELISIAFIDKGEELPCPECGTMLYGTEDGFTDDAGFTDEEE